MFLIHSSGDSRIGGADSFSDRLSCHYTVSMLAFFTFMVTTRQYVGEPISCWCPVTFSSSMVSYTNKVCWTTSTYYLPAEVETIPKEDDPHRRISYYQWMSLIFVAQAVLFYVPRAIWILMSVKSGISIHTITDTAIEFHRKSDPKRCEQMMTFMTRTFKKYINERNHRADNTKHRKALYGTYLTCLYIFIKLLYILNVVGQIFLLNIFLGTNYYWYGVEVVTRMINGEDWTTSHRFPRTAFCDFKIRVVGNIHRHTVQCSLPMNLLNEMFFIILWFWFVFVVCVTITSLAVWIYRALNFGHRSKFIRNRLYAMGKIHRRPLEDRSSEDKWFQTFVNNYLRRDGFFIICLVAKNSNDIVAAEVTSELWDWYKKKQQEVGNDEEKAESRL